MKSLIKIATNSIFLLNSCLVIIFILSGCTHKGKFNLEDKSSLQQRNKIEIKKVLHESYYLKHRIKDCSDRIKFMNKVVKPSDNIENDLFLSKTPKGHRDIYIQIDTEQNAKPIRDLQYFYFDLDCFQDQNYDMLLDLVLPKSDFIAIDKLIKSKPDFSASFVVFFENFQCFGFWIEEGKTTNLSWCETVIN